MSHQLRRLALAFAAAFLLVAAAAGYWVVFQPDTLLRRPDNPRRLLSERRIPRGSIYDRQGALLAESAGAPGALTRHYPYPDLAPVLGYVSPFYGTAGVEAAADEVLHGEAGQDALTLYWQTGILNAPPPGRGVSLTIDLQLQTAADQALGSRVGAVVLLDAASGEILALASHPTYNPNTLDTDWETLVNDPRAPLLNRATLNLYQPGGALQPMVLAAALRAGQAALTDTVPAGGAAVTVNALPLACLYPLTAKTITLAQAFQAGCPAPFMELGKRLEAHTLDQLFADFRLFEAPQIGIPTTAAARPTPPGEAGLTAIGQSRLTITPLHLALVTAALARRGQMPVPHLLAAEQDAAGAWQPVASNDHPIAAIAPEFADQVRALMPQGFPAVALTNAQGQKLAWFAGFAPFAEPRYAVAVLLEEGDVTAATQIGQSLLQAAAQP